MDKSLKSACIGEFIGTALLIFFGVGCVAAARVAGATFGLWEISIVWGLAVALAVYASAGLSGAHLNPAVTIALWKFACFDGKKVIPYIIAQILGAFFAAAIIFFLYKDLFVASELAENIVRGESIGFANVFSTYPNAHISVFQAFTVEIIITAVLMALILALTDDGNGVPKGALAPLLIGLLVAVIGAATGPLTGFAMNPARDFGPKMFAFLAGWGEIAFTGGRDIPYFLVPIFGPIIGALLGGFLYTRLIGKNLPCNCQ
ncbi:glycerol uptake facilitator protein [Bisgaardia hudsonensis]|uniref:Glycerol uptake facilitator protein n=1 Tax=Bisgaardia hudsonensis TaxID=109472 RepID=A0A4R2N2H7_9PAST|nr:MIP/aquaporin family protein [Bisgaardia hudsonensis]QLB12477.1 aquaporin [Bisgaardia hudsonensis]TCP14015.1 glycerol uptake facilitator protein [Bisgaardia hudsonensis]